MQDKILILDFGSQVTELIARRIREMNVYCEIHPNNISNNFIKSFSPKGIILSGSHISTYREEDLILPEIIWNMNIPILGICYGMFAMALKYNGIVEKSLKKEFGYSEVYIHGSSKLLDGIEDFTTKEGNKILKVWMSHGDKVTKLPKGFNIIASTDSCPIAGIADEKRNYYAIQFHPEVSHTKQGKNILEKFILKISGVKQNWIIKNHVDDIINKIRYQIKNEEVILGISGGIDSTVAAILINKAIGKKLTCVFVDNGLLRLNESEQVLNILKNINDIKIIYVNAQEIFLSKLKGITDPEIKRKIIGIEFINIFQNESKKLKNVKWLAQGTIYTDVIESGFTNKKNRTTVKIKSHHNVGGLPKNITLKLLEPLRELFKDEVRELGIVLGLSEKIIYRHPFPGPGLGIRILGEIKKEYIYLLRHADSIFIEELQNTTISEKDILYGFCDSSKLGKNWYSLIDEAFAIFLPIKTVGVMGDKRTYGYTISLRAVQTKDFMTANWAYLPHNLLEKVSNRIINEVSGITRVVYDICGKPPATIEWE